MKVGVFGIMFNCVLSVELQTALPPLEIVTVAVYEPTLLELKLLTVGEAPVGENPLGPDQE